jgi:hypothetical protein
MPEYLLKKVFLPDILCNSIEYIKDPVSLILLDFDTETCEEAEAVSQLKDGPEVVFTLLRPLMY